MKVEINQVFIMKMFCRAVVEVFTPRVALVSLIPLAPVLALASLMQLPAQAQTLAQTLAPSSTQSLAQVPTQPQARQDPAALRINVEQFLQRQTVGLPGEVKIEIGQIDTRMNLPACMQPEPFLAHGSRVWGKTSVGVRCTAPSPWTIYVTANVHVFADYLVAAVPLAQGQTITNNDFTRMRGDLSTLPAGVITDAGMAIGRTTMSSLQLGAPLRQDTLRSQPAVQMGQTIRLMSAGSGFKVTTEARALGNGTEGQTVQARTPAGLVISGIAKAGGIVEVAF